MNTELIKLLAAVATTSEACERTYFSLDAEMLRLMFLDEAPFVTPEMSADAQARRAGKDLVVDKMIRAVERSPTRATT